MDDPWLLTHSPSRLMRWLLRVPLALYRFRLGWLLGHRFLVIGHRGRVTGQIHHSVVEVIHFDQSKSEAFVITPWPTKSNWYRNLLAAPAVEVWIGSARYRPEQRFPALEETASMLDSYARKSSAEAVGLYRLMGWRLDLPESRRDEIVTRVGAVAFRPRSYLQT